MEIWEPLRADDDGLLLLVAVGGAGDLPPAFDAAQRPVEVLEEVDWLAGVERREPDALPEQPQRGELLDQRWVLRPTRRERAGESKRSDYPHGPGREVVPPVGRGGGVEQFGSTWCNGHLTVEGWEGQPCLGSRLAVLVFERNFMGRTADSGIMHPKSIGHLLHRVIIGLMGLLHFVLQDLLRCLLIKAATLRQSPRRIDEILFQSLPVLPL